MHLHLPALNCLTYGASTPPLSFGTVTPYRRLLWARSRPTFELNCTLNKINEILVSGGWVLACLSLGYWKELSSFYVLTMKNCALLNSFTKPSLLTLKNLKSSQPYLREQSSRTVFVWAELILCFESHYHRNLTFTLSFALCSVFENKADSQRFVCDVSSFGLGRTHSLN